MDADQSDPRNQTPVELAGSHYEEMMQDKETALGYLSAADPRVCLAAILICEATWNCGGDSRLVDACRKLSDINTDDSLRIAAIQSLGIALSSSRERDTSQFLANLVLDSANSLEVRRDAYWALREIQFGLGDVDLDAFLKGTICMAKSIMRSFPGRFSEDETRRALTPRPGFPEDFWESADEIDWDFVRRFANTVGG